MKSPSDQQWDMLAIKIKTLKSRLRLFEARAVIMAHEMDNFRRQDSRELVANIHPALDRWAQVLRLGDDR